MATNIRRCLFIGIGGTGMRTLLTTKKMFLEAYGEVPPMIGFLGIDADSGAYNKFVDSKLGEVKLAPNEQVSISVNDARPIYKVHTEHMGWLANTQVNLTALDRMTIGCGQIRTNGRFAVTVNHQKLKAAVMSALNKITAAAISNNPKYNLLATDTEIHLVFSLCGGTGSGAFLNLAYLLREIAPNCKLYGYAVLSEVFKTMYPTGAAMQHVRRNAYGALLDLDWFMSVNPANEGVTFDYITQRQTIDTFPFDTINLLDNKNENGDTYSNIDEISDMISLALITSSGQLSVATASVSDNVIKQIQNGAFNVGDKMAWVSGMGACEIVFRGENLQKIYNVKAKSRIVEMLLNNCNDTNVIVNSWIDSPAVNIRENNGFDNVIDYMFSREPMAPFSCINDKANCKVEVDGYLTSAMPSQQEISNKIEEKSQAVFAQLDTLIKEEINKDCGVGAVESIILGIQAQVGIFMSEMRAELKDLQDREPQLEAVLETAERDLTEYSKRIFKIKINEYCESVIDAVNQLIVNRREIARRNAAIQFYTGLQRKLLDSFEKIKAIKDVLLKIIADSNHALASLQNNAGRSSSIFQIDLEQQYVNQIVVKDEELSVAQLMQSINHNGSPNGIYDFDEKSQSDINELFNLYINSLPESRKWKSLTIDDILNKMDEEAFRQMIRVAINKSKPLLRYDYKGYVGQQMPEESCYIGVPDNTNCRLTKDVFCALLPGSFTNVEVTSIGSRDRIVVYRQLGVLPAFAIKGIDLCKTEYNNLIDSYIPHIDISVYNKMQRTDFALEPALSVDDSLELWVKGLVFGLIRNENDQYAYKSMENGDPLDDYWISLSTYRDEAYEQFRIVKNTIRKEFNDEISKFQNEKGSDLVQDLIADVKANYLAKFSQIKMPIEEIKRKGNEAIRKLVTNELNFVKENM